MDIKTARVVVAAMDHLDECESGPAGAPLLDKALQQLGVDQRAAARLVVTAYTAGYEQAQTDIERMTEQRKGKS